MHPELCNWLIDLESHDIGERNSKIIKRERKVYNGTVGMHNNKVAKLEEVIKERDTARNEYFVY